MTLAIRKLFGLFFLGITAFHNVMGQTAATKPVKLFKSYKFDTGDAIIGIGLPDSLGHRNEQFNFIINNINDLNEFKESWFFKNGTNPETGKETFRIYYVRNKEMKNEWVVAPELHAIVTGEGAFSFNSSMLSALHAKSPVTYSTRLNALESKNDLLRFCDSVKTIPSLLFVVAPDALYEGSFEITIKPGSTLQPGAVAERIMTVCNKIKPQTPFKLFVKDGNPGNSANRVYVIRG